MVTINVRDARSQFKELLDKVAAGEEVAILRRGAVVARLVPPPRRMKRLPSLRSFRRSIRISGVSLRDAVLRNRAEGRF